MLPSGPIQRVGGWDTSGSPVAHLREIGGGCDECIISGQGNASKASTVVVNGPKPRDDLLCGRVRTINVAIRR